MQESDAIGLHITTKFWNYRDTTTVASGIFSLGSGSPINWIPALEVLEALEKFFLWKQRDR